MTLFRLFLQRPSRTRVWPYMLAQIVAEIHAPDRAVGDVGGEGEAVIVEGVGLSGYRAEEDAVFSAAGV